MTNFKIWILKQRYSLVLLKQLVITDFKLRYQGSVLGYVWSLLRPLALFAILYVVFAKFLRIGAEIENYPAYLLLGIVLWSFFTEITNGSVSAIVSRGDLIRKINFPKYIIVISKAVSALINFSINFVIIISLMLITGVGFRIEAFIIPLVLMELFVMSLSVGFLLSALFVRYRDVTYIWEVVLQAAFYATPILYPLGLVPEKAAKLLMLNPVAQVVQDVRYLLITKDTVTIDQLYGSHVVRVVPLALTVIVLALSVVYFKKRSIYFAEEV